MKWAYYAVGVLTGLVVGVVSASTIPWLFLHDDRPYQTPPPKPVDTEASSLARLPGHVHSWVDGECIAWGHRVPPEYQWEYTEYQWP